MIGEMLTPRGREAALNSTEVHQVSVIKHYQWRKCEAVFRREQVIMSCLLAMYRFRRVQSWQLPSLGKLDTRCTPRGLLRVVTSSSLCHYLPPLHWRLRGRPNYLWHYRRASGPRYLLLPSCGSAILWSLYCSLGKLEVPRRRIGLDVRVVEQMWLTFNGQRTSISPSEPEHR